MRRREAGSDLSLEHGRVCKVPTAAGRQCLEGLKGDDALAKPWLAFSLGCSHEYRDWQHVWGQVKNRYVRTSL